MQEGQDIVLVDRTGTGRPGKVAAVIGSGPSGYKTLHITRHDGSIEQNVPHGNDREQEPGRNFWLLPSEPIPSIETSSVEVAAPAAAEPEAVEVVEQ